MALVSFLALLIVQARHEFTPIQRDRLLIRSGPHSYVGVSQTTVFILLEVANAYALNVHCANEVPLQAVVALAVTVIQAGNTITPVNGSGCDESARLFIVIDEILCAVASLRQGSTCQVSKHSHHGCFPWRNEALHIRLLL